MWLRIPTRIPTSHSSAATEDLTSPSDALCQRLAVSVSWRGKLLRPQSWRLAWKTEGWRTRLSGLTLPPSQAESSVAAWLDSLVGSPAKTSALPADKPESRENGADCSLRSSDSFASWNPSSGSFLRTSRQFSIFQQEQPFLENLPRSGSMRNGELYERPMLVDRTGESGRSSWPTPMANDVEKRGQFDTQKTVCLTGVAQTWPTPRGTDGAKGGPNQAGSGGDLMLPSAAAMSRTPAAQEPGISPEMLDGEPGHRMFNKDTGRLAQYGLVQQAAMWRTPAATEEQSDRMSTEAMLRGIQNPNQQINLSDQARMWMTPNLPLGGRKNTAEQVQAKGKTDSGKRQISLEGQTMHWPNCQTPLRYVEPKPNYQTRLPNETSNEYWARMTAYETENGINPAEGGMHWPTPKARDSKSAEDQAGMMRDSPDLNVIASHFSLPAPPTSTHGGKSPSGSTRRLNPAFVDWLMGLIPGWTDYAPLETASYLSKVRSLLRSCLGGHAE